MKELDVTYIIVSGSDDIFSTQCLRNIMFEMEKDIDLIGLKTLYVYDTDGKYRGTLKHITSKHLLGVGKTINKRVLDAVNWRPWECSVPRNSGTDAVATRNIAPYVKTTAVVDGVIVDCKSRESLNKFSMFESNRHGQNADKNIFYNILSKEELEILNSIHQIGIPINFPNFVKRGRTLI
jgi:predicted phosphoadenosine phosphosulfate sulfurtransferase